MKKKKASVQKKKRLFRKKLTQFGFWSKRHWYRLFTIAAIVVFLLLLPGQNYYDSLQIQDARPLVRLSVLDNFVPSLYPLKTSSEPAPALTAESVVIRDQESFVPLFELNPDERLRPASITKLMTALVALDYYKLDDVITVRRLAPVEQEADMGLAVGDKITVRNLMYGLLVPSGNDAAYTLADNYEGGIENFLYAMNQKAKSLNMENTHFQNPAGFDNDNHYTTAKDLSLLASEVLKNKFINEIVSTKKITLTDALDKKKYPVTNVNELLGTVLGVDGLKTGFTDEAGQCLITSVSRNGHRVVIVVLKSQDRFGESASLAEWVYRSFNWIDVSGPS
jgi:D-alanyl-D-alanine carboxypeptidase (penicillin-binding protein 5/6)